MTCSVCREFPCAVCSDCFEQKAISRQLEKEWEDQEAKSQKEIEEEQLKLNI